MLNTLGNPKNIKICANVPCYYYYSGVFWSGWSIIEIFYQSSITVWTLCYILGVKMATCFKSVTLMLWIYSLLWRYNYALFLMVITEHVTKLTGEFFLYLLNISKTVGNVPINEFYAKMKIAAFFSEFPCPYS